MENKYKIWVGFYVFMSHLNVFILGVYTYAATHGKTIESYEWAITCFFGLYFFIMSLRKKED